jgi:hypothetical protein
MAWSSRGACCLVAGLALPLTSMLVGCGDPPLACAELDLTCTPLYAPTFDNVYANTLATSCGDDRNACHSDSGRAGDLSLADPLTAYQELVDPAHDRVRPGDVACSTLVARVYSADEDLVMPAGSPLSAAEQCAIALWVAAGAPGPSAAQREAAP